jgi:ribonuclease J
MTDTVKMAMELGYLHIPEGMLGRIEELRNMPPEEIVLVTTCSQGEPTSALVRIANRDHPQVHIVRGDTVIISATPIPGNESLINRTIDSLSSRAPRCGTVRYRKCMFTDMAARRN